MKTAKQALAVTKASLAARANVTEQEINTQVESVMAEVERVARTGQRSLEYRKDLKQLAVKELRARGFKVRDDGEHVASIYTITW